MTIEEAIQELQKYSSNRELLTMDEDTGEMSTISSIKPFGDDIVIDTIIKD